MTRIFNLDVFVLAHEITLDLYRLSLAWPDNERYGLTSQIRRAASSVGMNLCEGSGRRSAKDRQHFVTMALGSCRELQYQLMLARDLGYLTVENYERTNEKCSRVEQMLYKLHASIKS